MRNESRNRNRRKQRLIGSLVGLEPDLLTGPIKMGKELPIRAEPVGQPAGETKFARFLKERQAEL